MGTIKSMAARVSSFNLGDYSTTSALTNGSTTSPTVVVTAIASAVTVTTTTIISYLFLLFLLQFSARFFYLQVAAMESCSIC